METIDVTNFLNIDKAVVEVRDITLFIGPQAQGKSVVAKLLYFFRWIGPQSARSLSQKDSYSEFRDNVLARFEAIFPRYAWKSQNFNLEYSIGGFTMSLTWLPDNGHIGPTLKLPKQFKATYDAVAVKMGELEDQIGDDPDVEVDVEELLLQNLPEEQRGFIVRNTIFIPAARSFFSTLQRNVWTYLADDLGIDPLVKEFGRSYEIAKRRYRRLITPSFRSRYELELLQKTRKDLEQVVDGTLRQIDDEDWIVKGERRTKVAQASSGQQEALPLLATFGDTRAFRKDMPALAYIIEEPEAHLFPVSQRTVVELLARLRNVMGHRFVLTTHSPYVLTALNNLIYADRIYGFGKSSRIQVLEVVSKDKLTPLDLVSAYSIQDGKATSIIDEEAGLIGASVIEQVSDEFELVFDRLSEILIAHQS